MSYSAGIPMVSAAGNGRQENVDRAPYIYDQLFCVAAVDRKYTAYEKSNWGPHVNMLAPGVDIWGAGLETGTQAEKSGTSMASAYVFGIMATFLSFEGPALNSDPKKLYLRVVQNSISKICKGFTDNTVNLFATTGIDHPDKFHMDPYFIPRDELSDEGGGGDGGPGQR